VFKLLLHKSRVEDWVSRMPKYDPAPVFTVGGGALTETEATIVGPVSAIPNQDWIRFGPTD